MDTKKQIAQQLAFSGLLHVDLGRYALLCSEYRIVSAATARRAAEGCSPTRRAQLAWIARLLDDAQDGRATTKPRPLPMVCDCCGTTAVTITGASGSSPYYKCLECGASVGAHRGDLWPQGMMAKADVRRLRQRLHSALDPLWRDSGIPRTSVYRTVARIAGASMEQCHIANVQTPIQARRMLEAVIAARDKLT